MDPQPDTEIRINVDGRTIVALPGPEDQRTLASLLGKAASITLQPSSADTEGHLLANEIAVDVEGHAMTLRLPNGADAAAVRRMLAVGALTASLVVGGALASSYGQTQSQAPAAGGSRAAVQAAGVQAADHVGMADSASQLAATEFAASRSGVGSAAPITVTSATARGQDIEHVGLADGASQAAADEFAVQRNAGKSSPSRPPNATQGPRSQPE